MKRTIILLLLGLCFSLGATNYLMIGPEAFESTCQPLLDLRDSQGFTSSYLSVEEIWANPDWNGVDKQEEIRKAIFEYWYEHNTKYVVIVGTTNLVPVRHLIVSEDGDFDYGTGSSALSYFSAASDLYYSCLGGNFNFDGDTRYGEMTDGQDYGLLDLTINVPVGRILAGSIGELQNHIFKIISYELAPPSTDVLMVGTEHTRDYDDWDLFNGDLLNAAFDSTLAGAGYSKTTYFEVDDTYDAQGIRDAINSNNHEILLNGQHADPYGIISMNSNNVGGYLTNTSYFFLYTTGCSAANFKVGSPYNPKDSFTRAITAQTPHGAYAYIGHTSTGWPESIETYLTRMLFHSIEASTNPQEDRAVGNLLKKAKNDILTSYPDDFNGNAGNYRVKRQLYFNANLIGDPLSPLVKTDVPVPANPGLPDISVSESIEFVLPAEEKVFAFDEEAIEMSAVNSSDSLSITSAKFYYQLLPDGLPQYLNESFSTPYECTWEAPPLGDYLLIVEGYNGMVLVDTDRVFIRVADKNIPTVDTIYFPKVFPQFAVGQPIYYAVEASDSDGWVEAAKCRVAIDDGALPHSQNDSFESLPFVGSIIPTKAGVFTVTIEGTVLDNHYFESDTFTSDPFTYTVVEVNPPEVELLSPADGSEYIIGDTVLITINGDDPLNWKNEAGELESLGYSIVYKSNDSFVDSGDVDLDEALPQSAEFIPEYSGTFIITVKATDDDGLVAEESVEIHVTNPDDPFSFERPGLPWTSSSANLSNDYVTKTEGAFSLKINGTGNDMEIISPAFSTEEFDVLSNEISLDIYIPSPITPNPGGYGTLNIYIEDYIIGTLDFSDYSASLGSWITARFPISTGLQHRMNESYSNWHVRIVISTAQIGDNYRIDDLRFSGEVYGRGPSIPQNMLSSSQYIQAEDFDFGGQNNAYYDSTTQNSGGGYRLTQVDLGHNDSVADPSDYVVGWTAAGEWLEYTINVDYGLGFVPHITYSSPGNNGSFHFVLDGTTVSEAINLPSTGGYNNYQTIDLPDFHISSGEHSLRFVIDTAEFNLDKFQLTPLYLFPNYQLSVPGIIELEDFDVGGSGVSYFDTSYMNLAGAPHKNSQVDVLYNESNQAYGIGYIQNGEWLNYSIVYVSEGVYDISVKFASNDSQGGKSVTLSMGDTVLGTIPLWNTGGWVNWQTATLYNVYVPPSNGTPIKVSFNGANYNVDHIRIDNSQLQNSEFNNNLDNWNLNVYNGASANLHNVNGEMHTLITQGGSQDWNIQITQAGLTLENGKSYIVSFEAAAAIDRSINVNIGMADNPYTSYGGATVNLSEYTTYLSPYSFTFTMTQASDTNARIEFNLGIETADVYIDNVYLREIYDPNMIENGNFTNNSNGWSLAIYEGASAWNQTSGGVMEVIINAGGSQAWNVQLSQAALTVENGKSYVITFDAWSDINRSINMNIGQINSPYTSYGGDDFALTSAATTFTYTFSMTQVTDSNARFEFNLGNSTGDVFIDNVRMEVQN
ncbi:MAG: carbohydrate binding domain-containing protein [Spirochaetales bacterium]|nr:carbohydrate binding domain-containing protein [Spirochaetales bacterium]